MEYRIIPIAKPRMTRRDKWLDPPRPRVKRYWDFCNWCKLEKVALPCYGAHVTFILPLPESLSKKTKKTRNGKPHTIRPDLDNLIKSLSDAIYENDSVIYDIWATKIWGYEGKIIIDDIMTEVSGSQ